MLTHVTDLLKGSWRYAAGLRGFLSRSIDLEEAKAVITQQLQDRDEIFLRILEGGVFGNPQSPYKRLLDHAGYNFEGLQSLVRNEGLEATLSQLYDSGVFVTLEEFKGRAPISRPGIEFEVREQDFENPLNNPHFQGSTGGSRSNGSRVPFNFNFLIQDAAACLYGLHANGVVSRPIVICNAAPPLTDGFIQLFRLARAGYMPRRWFASNKPGWNRQGLQGRALMMYTLASSRLFGRPVPRPEHPSDVSVIVGYISELVRTGTPPVVRIVAGQAVRVCLAAERSGSDISGTVFYCGGEPYTAGKAAVLERVGARGITHYGLSESGILSFKCSTPTEHDDMHVLDHKAAILPRTKQLAAGLTVQALHLTIPVLSAPKIMLNVESGDYGSIEERDCDCIWQQFGFKTHIHSVRSYEKLSSEGVTFMGSMLYELLEETLPARFGGNPTDYQLVEEEEDGLPRVNILVSPRLGPVDEGAVMEAIFDCLGFADWSRRQAQLWRQSGTLGIQRREPYATGVGKILPLHVVHADKASIR